MCLHHRVPELLAALADETTTQEQDVPDTPPVDDRVQPAVP
jgi:hypothetical protein